MDGQLQGISNLTHQDRSGILIASLQIIRRNEDMEFAAYVKTWTGILVNQSSYESNYEPRGGGWGSVRNVLFSNFQVSGADNGPTITESSGGNSSTAGSSLMEISNVAFVNFTGYLSGNEKNNRTADVSCEYIGLHKQDVEYERALTQTYSRFDRPPLLQYCD